MDANTFVRGILIGVFNQRTTEAEIAIVAQKVVAAIGLRSALASSPTEPEQK